MTKKSAFDMYRARGHYFELSVGANPKSVVSPRKLKNHEFSVTTTTRLNPLSLRITRTLSLIDFRNTKQASWPWAQVCRPTPERLTHTHHARHTALEVACSHQSSTFYKGEGDDQAFKGSIMRCGRSMSAHHP